MIDTALLIFILSTQFAQVYQIAKIQNCKNKNCGNYVPIQAQQNKGTGEPAFKVGDTVLQGV